MALRLKMAASAALAVIATATAAAASDPGAVETIPAGASRWSPAGRFPDAARVGDQCRFTGLYAVLPGCTVVPLVSRWVIDLAARPAVATPVAHGGRRCRLTNTHRAGAAVTLTRGEPCVDGCGNTLVATGFCRVNANAGTAAIGPGCPMVCQSDPAVAVTVRQVQEVYECPGSGVLMEVYPGCHARFLTTLD